MIEPAVRGLDRYLYTIRHVPVSDEQHGARVKKMCFPLIWDQEDGNRRYNQCFAGLEPMVRELLDTYSYDVILSGERPTELPAPRLDDLDAIDAVDTPVLDLVRTMDRGLIRYAARDVEPAILIAQIVLAWPKAKIVVVATRVSEAIDLRRKLRELLGKVTLFTGNHHPAQGSRVVVATPNRLGDGAIAIEKRDIYITTNPEQIISSPSSDCNQAYPEGIKHLRRARLYGLLADETSVAPWQQSWMTALFGIDRVHIPCHGHHDLPVDVIFSRIHGGERPQSNKVDVVLKRRGIWHHHLRNRRVCALFQALARKKIDVLEEKFAEIAAHLHGRSWKRVGLLVESVEHGLVLARQMPDVPLIAGSNVWTEGLSTEDLQLIEKGREKCKKRRAIVTMEGLACAANFDVIVRADGGTGLPALPEQYQMVANGEDTRLLLIDFKDEHHPVLAKWSRQRRKAYVASGWHVAGRAVQGAMDLFVAQRPEM
jgi:hypothetical protein